MKTVIIPIIKKHRIGAVCGDIDEMIDRVREITENGEKRREMGERARQLIDSTYSASVTARLHIEFFEELMTR